MITLIHGDCLQKLKDLSSNSVDLIICDLPFGCLHPERAPTDKWHCHGQGKGNPWDVKIDLSAFWTEIKRVRKNDHTPCLHFTTTRYGFDLYASNPKEFRYDLVWNKNRGTSFMDANRKPMRSHEMVYVFSEAGAYYKRIDISGNYKEWKSNSEIIQSRVYNSPQGEAGFKNGRNQIIKTNKSGGDGKRCVLSVIDRTTTPGKNSHPTEKPVDLYTFLLKRYCPAGGTVLDPTFGSGNSALAAQQLGLHYIGIEKDATFYENARKKIIAEVVDGTS